MKEIKLNFKPSERSPNGRMYNSENFIKKLEESIKNGFLMLENSDNYGSASINIKKIIGFVDDFSVNDNNELIFKVNKIDDNTILDCVDECTLSLIGEATQNNETNISKIICLRPTPEYVYKTEEEMMQEYLESLKEGME